MKALRGLANLVLVLFVLGSAQTVRSAPLPLSTFAASENNWQGSKYYSGTTNDGGTVSCRINYTVYDTDGDKSAAETAFINSIVSDMPDMQQYLYVYQVFNNLSDSEAAINYFAIFNLSQTQLNVNSQNIGAKDDGAGGIGPSGSGLENESTRVVWNFGTSLLMKDDHSWYLVLSSEGGPVKGGYEVRYSESDTPAPPPIPEPATVALLAIGGLFLVRRKTHR